MCEEPAPDYRAARGSLTALRDTRSHVDASDSEAGKDRYKHDRDSHSDSDAFESFGSEGPHARASTAGSEYPYESSVRKATYLQRWSGETSLEIPRAASSPASRRLPFSCRSSHDRGTGTLQDEANWPLPRLLFDHDRCLVKRRKQVGLLRDNESCKAIAMTGAG